MVRIAVLYQTKDCVEPTICGTFIKPGVHHLYKMGFEDVREQLQQLMQRVDGLNAIVFSDRDGVPIVKVCRIGQDAFGNQIKPETLSSSVLAMGQAARLGMGNVKRMVVCKESNQVVCFNKKQVCVQLFASSAATTGMLLCLESELSSLAADLARVIETS